MRDLTLRVKGEYFKQIESGEKPEEFRLVTPYWSKRIVGREYDRVVITWGYPKSTETNRIIVRPWKGYRVDTITHPHFGASPVEIFAIWVAKP